MATYYSSYSNEYRLRLVITQGTQNVTNNTSVVSWTLFLHSGNKTMSVYSTYHATVNGVSAPNTTQTNVNIGYNSAVTLGSGSTTVTHNSDGTKSVDFSASFKTNSPAYYGGVLITPGTMTISGNFPLTTIPRYATITAFTASLTDRVATLSWTADKTISQWRWSSNSGSSYSAWTTINASSGATSVYVNPGSTYGFRIQVINSASGLITTSSVVSKTATKTPSTLTLNTTSQNIGSGITWTIDESYDYTHRITYTFGNASGWILGSDSAASNTSSGTWTLPTALANQIPNATSGSGTIYLHTYYGSTNYDGIHIGTKSYTFTAKVPNNTTWQPAIPTVGITDAGTRPTGITSYVQGKARAKVVSSSTAQGGASISSYRVIVSGIGTYYGSNITSGYLTGAGTVTITVRATDSRGYYREKSNTITVVAYSPPKLTAYSVSRGPNDQGTNLTANINFSISSIDNQNRKRYLIRYAPSNESWAGSLVDSTDYYTRSITHSATGVLDVNKSYVVEFYLEDSYTSVSQTRNIGTAFQLLDFNASGRGVAFGKVSESDSFEVGMPTILPLDTKLRGSSSGIANVSYLQFMENDGLTRQGFIGFGADNNDYLYIYNDFGSRFVMNKDIYINSNLTWHNGNVVYGSNSNGQYIQFPNGVQICWIITQMATALNTANGSIFSTGSQTWAYPSAFTGTPTTSVAEMAGIGSTWGSLGVSGTGPISTSFRLNGATSSSAKPWVSLLALGRWK